MAKSDGDTHDHGPPTPPASLAKDGKATPAQATPFPALAIWSTNLSSAAVASISGATGGVASGIVTCPLDVIKTKLQAGNIFYNSHHAAPTPATSQLYHGMVGTARTIIRQDGLRGMYRGLAPMLIGYLPTWAVYMAVYDHTREYLYDNGWSGRPWHKSFAQASAAVSAGACSTLTTNPIWVIKTRFMSQISPSRSDGARTPYHYTSTLDAARKMYRAEGLGVFYSGLGPALLGLTHVAIQFPLYEYFKLRFTGLDMGVSPASPSKGTNLKQNAGILGASFLSKICATSATYPHEVLRTRMQTQTRTAYPEHAAASGLSAHHHHSQALRSSGRRIGNTDGAAYAPKYKGVRDGHEPHPRGAGRDDDDVDV
ncbi:hypothetical protein LTR53_001773 [Teratosphaeriaceae sp. CCFEE 6253]|nr:hypothetical protein LTR53_001773 [Teratosphaeriaceae sp. CCFEE 6253]